MSGHWQMEWNERKSKQQEESLTVLGLFSLLSSQYNNFIPVFLSGPPGRPLDICRLARHLKLTLQKPVGFYIYEAGHRSSRPNLNFGGSAS